MTDQKIVGSPEDCHGQARAALDAATNAATEDANREYLSVAAEWLKLAAEINRSATDG